MGIALRVATLWALASSPAAAASPADVAIVLGTGAAPEGWANPLLVQRVCRGVAEYRAGRAKALLLSGGYTAGHIAEAEMMRAVAVAAGVPAGRLWIEDSSINTIENAVFCASVAKERSASTAILISHASHFPRAAEAFARAGAWTALSTAAADGTPPCFPAAAPLALRSTVEMLIVDVTEEDPLDAVRLRPADVPSPALVAAVSRAAAAYRAGLAKRLYFAIPEPSSSTFASGRGAAHGHISRTELARVLASAMGVAWDDLYISSGRRLGQIPGAVEPSENPWLKIPGARLAVAGAPERLEWWRAHLGSGLNALLPPAEYVER